MYNKALQKGDRYPPGVFHAGQMKFFYYNKITLQGGFANGRVIECTSTFPLACWEDGVAVLDMLHKTGSGFTRELGFYNSRIHHYYRESATFYEPLTQAETYAKDGVEENFIARYIAVPVEKLPKVKTRYKHDLISSVEKEKAPQGVYFFQGLYKPKLRESFEGFGQEIFASKEKVVPLEVLRSFQQEIKILQSLCLISKVPSQVQIKLEQFFSEQTQKFDPKKYAVTENDFQKAQVVVDHISESITRYAKIASITTGQKLLLLEKELDTQISICVK